MAVIYSILSTNILLPPEKISYIIMLRGHTHLRYKFLETIQYCTPMKNILKFKLTNSIAQVKSEMLTFLNGFQGSDSYRWQQFFACVLGLNFGLWCLSCSSDFGLEKRFLVCNENFHSFLI